MNHGNKTNVTSNQAESGSTHLLLPAAAELAKTQIQQVDDWHVSSPDELDPTEATGSLERCAARLHLFNFKLWHEEDKARDPTATDTIIAGVKRTIDSLNQKRNDSIEKTDEAILAAISSVQRKPHATMNSETPGSILDRLSINALRIYHMEEEAQRTSATDEHRARCAQRVVLLSEQRRDLVTCLHELFENLQQGTRFMKVYRQMKMYNDPQMNPFLYGKKTPGHSSS